MTIVINSTEQLKDIVISQSQEITELIGWPLAFFVGILLLVGLLGYKLGNGTYIGVFIAQSLTAVLLILFFPFILTMI